MHRGRLRGQCREGGRRSRPPRPARRAAEAMAQGPHPGCRPARKSRSCCSLPLSRTVKCLMATGDDRVHMLLVRGDHMGNEVKIGKLPGIDGWRWASDAEIVAATGCQPGYLGPVGIPRGHAADRRSRGRGDGRFRLRRQRAGLPPARRQLRPRLPRARPRRRPPQRRRRRPLARRPRHARDRARHRGRPRVRAGHASTRRRMGATLPRRRRSSRRSIEMGCYGIGVTRVVAAAIEQNHDDARHHLAGADGAVRRRDRARRLRPQRGGARASPTACTTSSRPPASRCCSTTAASARA